MINFVQYVVLYMVKSMGLILRDPIFFILAICSNVVYKKELGEAWLKRVLLNTAIGLVTGVFLSSILSYFHLTFAVNQSILILIPIALVMMFLKPKWGCFSYVVPVAFCIEGLLRLFELPTLPLNYPMLINLVGLLHMIEGALVALWGYQEARQMPFYEAGELKARWVMRQIWLVPLVLELSGTHKLLPLYAVLAYQDVATRKSPKAQSFKTGSLILVFGIFIILLNAIGFKIHMPIAALIILMPVMHEMIFIIDEGFDRHKKRTVPR